MTNYTDQPKENIEKQIKIAMEIIPLVRGKEQEGLTEIGLVQEVAKIIEKSNKEYLKDLSKNKPYNKIHKFFNNKLK